MFFFKFFLLFLRLVLIFQVFQIGKSRLLTTVLLSCLNQLSFFTILWKRKRKSLIRKLCGMRQFFILTKKLYFHVDNALILPILTICEQYVTTALSDTLNCLKFFYYQRVINRPNIHSKKCNFY